MLWFVNWFVSFSVFCHLSNDSEVLSDAQTVVALSQTIGVNYKLITAAQRYKLRKKKKKKNSSLFMLSVWYWYECILSLFHPYLCTKFWRSSNAWKNWKWHVLSSCACGLLVTIWRMEQREHDGCVSPIRSPSASLKEKTDFRYLQRTNVFNVCNVMFIQDWWTQTPCD